MHIDSAFPSKYLKTADLQGQAVTVVISTVLLERIEGDDQPKPVVYFQNKEKGLVLNKTNANMISRLHGGETDNWTGKQIEIFPTTTDFRGDIVDCLRVRALQQQSMSAGYSQSPPQAPPTQETAAPQSVPSSDLDDEIPF